MVYGLLQCAEMWMVKICMTLQVMWFVVLNAIFIHSYLFHPYPSPGTVKCCYLEKRLKIALFHCIALFCLHMIPYGVIFGIIEQKIENKWLESIVQNWTCRILCITRIAFFGKHHLPLSVNIIYYHFPSLSILYHIL